MKRLIYIATIIFLVALGPALLFVWHGYIEPNLGKVKIVVAANEIPRGNIINEKDIKTVNIDTELVPEGSLARLDKIVGKEAARTLVVNELFVESSVIGNELTPKQGEFNFAIPQDWIKAMPGSLLRGDYISITLIKSKDNLNGSESDVESKTQSEDGPQKETVNVKTTLTAPLADVEKLLSSIPVSYVKGSNNQEIISEDKGRKKPSGTVQRLEVIVTDQQKKAIVNAAQLGYELLIVY